MYITQEVNHVLGNIDKKQCDNSVELSILRKNVQKITLYELDRFVRPMIRHCQSGVARGGIGLMRPFGHKGLEGVLVQRARVVR